MYLIAATKKLLKNKQNETKRMNAYCKILPYPDLDPTIRRP